MLTLLISTFLFFKCFKNSIQPNFIEDKIIIVGLGGVGGHCAANLVRGGFTNFKLIDFDQVSLSSLNRSAFAKRNHVGIPKVEAAKFELLKINPKVKIESVNNLLNSKNVEQLLNGKIKVVIDCIDNIDTKVDLIHFCKKNSINILSAMGSGCKTEPIMIQLNDISNLTIDPLGKKIKKILQKKYNVRKSKLVFYSF
eukprot:TRINITY_DN4448_c0_g1_i4.p2 TRINITY_DN4448_c0_g1~~TRINITY_DN4448_c0_g1_i4.p2  ORF type:complete len:197 (+),score=37.41 TRINITY_DN4448_c0_g1_i4:66-656(+)